MEEIKKDESNLKENKEEENTDEQPIKEKSSKNDDTNNKPKEDSEIISNPTIDNNIEESITKKETTSKQNKQTIFIITIMLSMILIIVLVPYVKTNYFDKFTYINLDFQKTQLGDLIFYSTSIPVANINGQVIGEYSMPYNRKDPRDLEYINFYAPYKKITFKRENKTVFLTLDPDMNACDDNVIAISNLAGFLNNFAKFDIKSGVSNEEYAKDTDLDYITCDTHPDNSVISITSGNETNIRKRGGNCFILTYNNCEIIEVTEKFNWIILEDYISNFERIE